MGFTDLVHVTSRAIVISPDGALVCSRPVGGKGGRFMQIRLGSNVAKSIGLTLGTQKVAVRAGNGSDEGKIALCCDERSGFAARRQANGNYIIAVGQSALGDLSLLPDKPVKVDAARVIPSNGRDAPLVVIKLQVQSA